MTASGYVPLPDRGVLALSGPDTRPFLQGLISSDVEKVDAERVGYGALLTPQGKFLFDFMLIADGEGLLLESERQRLPDLRRRLLMYRLRSKVEIDDLSGELASFALLGEETPATFGLPATAGAMRVLGEGRVYVDPRLAELGARAVLPAADGAQSLAQHGLAELPASAHERVRLALGVPDGARDLVVERATLLESGFEELHGVDFAKGCFVGQELTARMRYRGLVRKRLLPVTFSGEPPAPGTLIEAGKREIGEIRSGIEGLGLALIRLERLAEAEAAGLPLLAAGVEVIPERPGWLRI